MPSLERLLETTGWVLADGATGTNFFNRGLETGYPPELWNVEHPDEVTALHAYFIEAGSQLVLTNSFGGNAHRLKLHNAQDRVHEMNSAGARIARHAADDGRDRTGREVVVAGSKGANRRAVCPHGCARL